MKSLVPFSITIAGKHYKVGVDKEIPSVVVDFWKSNGQIDNLVKSKVIIDDSKLKSYESKKSFSKTITETLSEEQNELV